jgi:hypothetical protein
LIQFIGFRVKAPKFHRCLRGSNWRSLSAVATPLLTCSRFQSGKSGHEWARATVKANGL